MAKKLEELVKEKKSSAPVNAKMARIAEACAALQKKFGKESVNFLGNKKAEPLPRFSSGSIALDKILGGGYPEGRMIEIFGPASSGKTTICYHALASIQKKYPDGWCGFVDSEQSFDPIYAESIGVNVAELVTAQPDTGTDAFGMVQGLIEAGAKAIVIDSVAAMMPKEEAEEEDYGHNSIGAQARMMSKGLRKLTAIAGKHKCTLIFTNQIRNKIGVMWGNPEVTTGGKALEYYASVRLRVSQCGKVEDTVDGEKVITAIETRLTTSKNKTFAPFKTCEIVIRFGEGIDNDAGILDLAFQYGIIAKGGGGNYTINGEKIRGLPALKAYLEQNPELYEEIKQKTRDAMENDKKENVVTEEEAIDADSMTDDEIAQAAEASDNDDAETGEV
jgi:recombination protein RecA